MSWHWLRMKSGSSPRSTKTHPIWLLMTSMSHFLPSWYFLIILQQTDWYLYLCTQQTQSYPKALALAFHFSRKDPWSRPRDSWPVNLKSLVSLRKTCHSIWFLLITYHYLKFSKLVASVLFHSHRTPSLMRSVILSILFNTIHQHQMNVSSL